MTTLRPLTPLTDATLTVVCDHDYSQSDLRRTLGNKLKSIDRIPQFEGDTLRVNLGGVTVSELIAAHKALAREAKRLRKWDYPVEVAYGGEAADMDLNALGKEPTPDEDYDIMRKVRNGSSLTGSKMLRAFELMGLDAGKVKNGRKLVGFRVNVPGVDQEVYNFNYGNLSLGFNGDRDEDEVARYKAAREWMVAKASELLGVENPNERAGLPTRARGFRTDLTIRTCPCCFRDIKASEHTKGRMAHHGYTIEGRDYSGFGGWRSGSCGGTDRLPWEKSCEPAKELLADLLAYSDKVEARLAALEGGEVNYLLTDKYDWKTRSYLKKTVTPDDGYEWKSALENAITKTRRTLKGLWDGSFESIPWLRMAIRTWEPVADNHIAVGAPNHEILEEDFVGKPESLG